jgi:hypothetical protein
LTTPERVQGMKSDSSENMTAKYRIFFT